MKIGFCMLLWTTRVDHSQRRLLEDIKSTGYDGVEVPIFEGEPDEYAEIGQMLDEIGLERTAITVIPTEELNPLAQDPGTRRAALAYINHCVECCHALGAEQLAGPLHQTLGYFSGAGPTEDERARAREVHLAAGDYAADRGVRLVLEAVNRFETYFVNTMSDLATYLDTVAHPSVTGMYDTFHANIEERDPVAAIRASSRHISYVHVSENDRGVPGRGHVPWPETFSTLKRIGYDGWLTIEAFGRGLPELAAATRIWRDLSDSPESVYRDGFTHIRDGWASA